MATYTFYGYSASVLVFNAGTGNFDFAADYNFTQDRIKIDITDDDATFDGDDGPPPNDEIGTDNNQTAVISTPGGTVLGSGLVYDEAYGEILLPGGGTAWLERVEIGGQHFGYISSVELTPGTSYPLQFSEDVNNSNSMDYASLNSIPCFAHDTLIKTNTGMKPADGLQAGDLVLTRHAGLCPVQWVGRFQAHPAHGPNLPVRIFAGALGNGLPRRDVVVSANHRIAIASSRVQLWFGVPQVLVPALALTDLEGVDVLDVSIFRFVHFALATHQLVNTSGLWSETLLPARQALRRMRLTQRCSLSRQQNGSGCQTVLPSLSMAEARILFQDHKTFAKAG